MTTSDPVDQARAWLEEKTGQAGSGWSPLAGEGSRRRRRPEGAVWVVGSGCRVSSGRYADGSRRLGRTASGRGRRPADRSVCVLRDGPASRTPKPTRSRGARTIALRKLTGQARTRHELDQALQKKNVPDEVATTVLDRLEEVGLVDDEAFAQDWVESRQRRRHLSRSALRRELQLKGVDRDQVDAALATVDADDELAAARALVAKKQGATRGLDPLVRQRRLVRCLGQTWASGRESSRPSSASCATGRTTTRCLTPVGARPNLHSRGFTAKLYE